MQKQKYYTTNQDSLPDASENDSWNRLICIWADQLDSAIPLARLAWHVTRLFYEHPVFIPNFTSVPLTIPPLEMVDIPSDYSSDEEPAFATARVES
jgi:hypothetical protein